MIRTLLFDDESSARANLRERLAAHPEVTVVGESGSFAGARTLLLGTDYELVFLDIPLRGGSGFDLVAQVWAGARFVFVTASGRHALRAIQVNALDYLLKPVAPERLATSLRRLDSAPEAKQPSVSVVLTPDDRVLLRTDHAPRFVLVRDISAILAEGNYTEVACVDGACHFVRRTLATWEALLPPAWFARSHRRALVNVAHIERTVPLDDEGARLHLTGIDAPIPVSRRQWPDLRMKLAAVRAACTP